MILRKFRLGAVIVSLALLLSACVEVKGDISVNSAARLNGEITYTLDKSFAAAAGIASLADLNSEASSSEDPIEFCPGVPFIEDSSNYILNCSLKDALGGSDDISASVVGSNIVFRYRSNLDAASDQTDFGSASITVRFLDPVVSVKESKVGLVKKVDSLTYRISGYATELMDIEIIANCSSRCGINNSVATPTPSKTLSPADAAKAATDAANKAAELAAQATEAANKAAEVANKAAEAADAKAAAELKAQQEADAKAAAELKAKQEVAAAKAAEELKAKLIADAKAAADKAAADAKAAADKAAAELKVKLEAEAKAAAAKALADKAAAEKVLADAKAAAAKILAAAKAKAAAATKKTTITCVKGKLTQKVTAVKPVCPKGYKKKA